MKQRQGCPEDRRLVTPRGLHSLTRQVAHIVVTHHTTFGGTGGTTSVDQHSEIGGFDRLIDAVVAVYLDFLE